MKSTPLRTLGTLLCLLAWVACGDHEHAGHAGHTNPMPAATHDAPMEDGVAVFSELPEFALVDQDGAPYDRTSLTRAITVADFVFTTCPDFCPLLTSAMAKLQRELAADPTLRDVRLVSFSVDPETDTPEAFTAYAGRYDADLSRWSFVTGERPALIELIEKGYKLPVMKNPDAEGSPFLHSDRFVLTDTQGRIRGYYAALEDEGRAQLLADLRRLAAAAPSAAALERPADRGPGQWAATRAVNARRTMAQPSASPSQMPNFAWPPRVAASSPSST
ncbi:MAG: SCO family protein [Myxococcota bacterium]